MADRRQEILDAALGLADEKGLDAVSMRAVAERAGVTPMALYPYVGSKAALLDGMVGRLFAGLVPADAADADPTAGAGPAAGTDPAAGTGRADQDWRQRLHALARSARGLVHRHPWAAALLFARPAVTPEGARTVVRFYAALLDAGVPAAEVPRLERLVSTLILGYAASEAGGRFGPGELDPRARRGLLLPAHGVLVRWLEAPVDWDAEFEADLDDLMRLIETAASGRSRQPESRRANGPSA